MKICPSTYHGGGLFPLGERGAYIIVPHIYLPTKWCQWCLSGQEMMHVLDIPDEVSLDLSSQLVSSICKGEATIPLKCTMAIVHRV